MNLDPRIIEGKRPLTCFDLEEAEEYVGKKCYISNEYDFFRNLDFTQQRILNGVEDCETPFHYDSDKQAEFCLPCDWVKDPEKKYRAFTLTEWINQHEIGQIIHYRSKSEEVEAHIMYMGTYHHKGKGTIVLGVASFTLDCLFEDCEIEINGEWQPFGTEVKEE